MKTRAKVLCVALLALALVGCAGTPEVLKSAEKKGLAELTTVQQSIAALSTAQITAKREDKLAEIAARHLSTLTDLENAGVLTPDSAVQAEAAKNAALAVLDAALAADVANYAQLLTRIERAKSVWSASLGYRSDVVEVDTAFLLTVKDYLASAGDVIPAEYQEALQQMIDSLLGNDTEGDTE